MNEQILKNPPYEIAKNVIFKEYNRGDTILFQGNAESNVYIILEGCVKVCSVSPAGKLYVSQYLKDIDIFGEVEAILQTHVDNMILAQTNCRIMQMKNSVFFDYMRKNWDFSYAILELMAKKLTETNEKAKQRYVLTVDEQIYHFLEENIKNGRYIVEKSIIKQEIYATIRSVNRSLKKYAECGAIIMDKELVRIVDEEKLISILK